MFLVCRTCRGFGAVVGLLVLHPSTGMVVVAR